MNSIAIALVLLLSTNLSFAHSKKFKPSSFDITPLNSPVHGDDARFLLKLPKGFTVDKVYYFIIGPKLFNFKMGTHKEIQILNSAQGPELKISVKNWKTGFYRMYVKVKDKKKVEHVYRSSYRDFVAFSIEKKVLPPPPKPDQNATLLGIDSDADGIRDDVQLWIESNYANSQEIKLAAKQYAQALQNAIVNKDNKEKSIEASLLVLEAGDCLHKTQAEKGVGIRENMLLGEKLSLMHKNTKERIEASIKLNENFSGNSYSSLTREEACNF